ncbi:NAD(P)-binding protein [Glonium stellatum]|uniref:NAD(P)-binding protein n=1 Tax=Glonium stellatum TaxID=574774 RepID=A0A8E2EV46_9PEZI|nr:NAD(P)-binding protein [Glonium stellatum]
MSLDLILITGTTGFVGVKVLALALNAGYRVRAPVRSQAGEEKLRSNKYIASLNANSRLETPVITDITVDGAYDEVVKGASSIIHIASPLVSGLKPEEFVPKLIEPARKGTTSMLYSALKSPTVKRVVITSSGIALLDWASFSQNETSQVVSSDSRTPFTTEYPDGEFQAYAASKVGALAITEQFIEKEKPHFDVISVMPTFVLGRNEYAEKPEDVLARTSRIAFGQILGDKNPHAMASTVCSIEDVAYIHFKAATDFNIPGNTGYLVTSDGPEGPTLSDALDIVKKQYPERVADGTLPCNGFMPTKRVLMDAEKTEKAFGITLRNYEQSVRDIADQYLELVDATKA